MRLDGKSCPSCKSEKIQAEQQPGGYPERWKVWCKSCLDVDRFMGTGDTPLEAYKDLVDQWESENAPRLGGL